MKVILSYGNYFNHGKNYQAKFIYENIKETEIIESYIIGLGNNELKPYQITFSKNPQDKPLNVIGGTNIPENDLYSFINTLLSIENSTIIIGKQEFTKDSKESIEDAIDSLHINITLQKGKYFGLEDCYFVKFKYASDEQRSEVSYDFNVNLNTLIGSNYTCENDTYIYPFVVDRLGKITGENTGIIGGTNIPTETLPFFLTRFINGYNAIITIGNQKFKSKINNSSILTAISSLAPKQNTKKRTRINA